MYRKYKIKQYFTEDLMPLTRLKDILKKRLSLRVVREIHSNAEIII